MAILIARRLINSMRSAAQASRSTGAYGLLRNVFSVLLAAARPRDGPPSTTITASPNASSRTVHLFITSSILTWCFMPI